MLNLQENFRPIQTLVRFVIWTDMEAELASEPKYQFEQKFGLEPKSQTYPMKRSLTVKINQWT